MKVPKIIALLGLAAFWSSAAAEPRDWQAAWPRTDFTKSNVGWDEIRDGGPPKDGIPPIDRPSFLPVGEVRELADDEPVIGLTVAGESRAYPLRVLIWHEIVNDVIAGLPVTVTYCPLCNAAIVFDRRLGERVLDFGTTGKLRKSDLVMYDRQTESWWQQYSGEAIVGSLVGRRLTALPARLESFDAFRSRAPSGRVLVPTDPEARDYGANPYVGYDTSGFPFLHEGEVPDGIAPLARVVVVGDRAWSLDLLRAAGRIEVDDLILTWRPGQRSALDDRLIASGREVGDVLVQRPVGDGTHADVVHHVTFAFVFHAFEPEGTLFR